MLAAGLAATTKLVNGDAGTAPLSRLAYLGTCAARSRLFR
jgi:hypothetical protein